MKKVRVEGMTYKDFLAAEAGLGRPVMLRRVVAHFEDDMIRADVPNWAAVPKFINSAQIAEFFAGMKNETREHFIALHLDFEGKIVAIDRVSIGTSSHCPADPREVLKTALLTAANGIVLVHNHPGADSNPSDADIEITRQMKAAGQTLNIKIWDHIIIGQGEHYSFFEGAEQYQYEREQQQSKQGRNNQIQPSPHRHRIVSRSTTSRRKLSMKSRRQ